MEYNIDYENLLYVDTMEIRLCITEYVERLRNDLDGYAYVGMYIGDEAIYKDLVKLMEFGVCNLDIESIQRLKLRLYYEKGNEPIDKFYIVYRSFIMELSCFKHIESDKHYTRMKYCINRIYKLNKNIINKCSLLGVDLYSQKILRNIVSKCNLDTVFSLVINSDTQDYWDDIM